MRSMASVLLAGVLAYAASVVPASAGVIVVDEFCSGAQSLSGTGIRTTEDPAGPAGPCPGALGGVRYLDYVATPTGGFPAVSLVIDTALSGNARLAVDDAVVNQLFIGWDGADTNSLTPGLAADLTAAGLNPQIQLFYLSDIDFNVTFIIRSGGVDRTVTVPALAFNTSVTIPLSNFVGLNPSAVEYIVLRVQNYGDQFLGGIFDTRLRFGAVVVTGTDRPQPPSTPEPASAALLALGAVAVVSKRRWRRAR